jgi:hypothetical protein
MELCRGEFYKYLRTRQPLDEEETRGVMKQLITGMQYLHSNGIIHRDLKLSNLLLTHSFDLKIADFGLAVKLQDANSEQKTMCGTPNYISPEIVSRLPYGLASDTWSIGCMMVTMFTGSPPFQSEQIKSTLERVTRGEYSLPSNISSSARSMITSLIQKDPKRRPSMSNLLKHEFFHGHIRKLSVQSVSNDNNILPSMNDLSIYSNKFTQNLENRSMISHSTVRSANYARNPVIMPEIANSAPLTSTISARSASRVASSSTLATRYNSHNEPYYTESPVVKLTNSHEDAILIANGIFCIISDIPVFSTVRLRTMQQNTKHGTISILKNACLLIDFKSEEFLIQISDDSQCVSYCDRSNPTKLVCSFKSSNLPSKLVKHFKYASRFVDLVKTKTPKIVFYSPQAKCTLMENTPCPDFHLSFQNGIKTILKGSIVEIQIPESLTEQYCKRIIKPNFVYKIDLNIAHLEDVYLPTFKHAQECLRQCLELEKSSRFDTCTKYPLILKSCHQSMTHKESHTDVHKSQPLIQSTTNSKFSNLAHSVPHSSIRSSNGGHSSIDVLPLYLSQVGWCISTSDKEFIMLFNDGIRANVHSITQMVTFISPDSEPER